MTFKYVLILKRGQNVDAKTSYTSKNASVSFLLFHQPSVLEWGGDARTRDECQARGAGRAGPACPPSVRPYVTHQKGAKTASESLKFH